MTFGFSQTKTGEVKDTQLGKKEVSEEDQFCYLEGTKLPVATEARRILNAHLQAFLKKRDLLSSNIDMNLRNLD